MSKMDYAARTALDLAVAYHAWHNAKEDCSIIVWGEELLRCCEACKIPDKPGAEGIDRALIKRLVASARKRSEASHDKAA